jgi:type I restriction enzyme R subunit
MMREKAELDNFIDPESLYPTIVTTSKLMSTGVDAQTCKVIALDSNINSMTEFKQIIGRGTRIREDYDKTHFTILDFRNVTEHFADPDFDGDPVRVKEIKEGDDMHDDEEENSNELEVATNDNEPETQDEPPRIIDGGDVIVDPPIREKIFVDGVPVEVAYKQTQFLDANGKLITESLKDYTKRKIHQEYKSMDDFLNAWDKHKRKYYILEELEKNGILLSELQNAVHPDIDPFDLILHVAFGQRKLKTRKERAENVRKADYFAKYSEKAQEVLQGLLQKYADEGLQHMEDIHILNVNPFTQYGSPMEIVMEFGGREQYYKAVEELEKEIYSF